MSTVVLESSVRDEVRRVVARKVGSGELEVPLMPAIAQRLLSLSSDPDASAREFAEVIRLDQQLAARVLRIANSPVYSARGGITNLKQAIVTVGVRTLRDLGLAVSMGERVFRSKLFDTPMQRVWKHSIATAFIAKRIADVKRWDTGFAFLGGLLHDSGKPVLFLALEGVLRQRAEWGALGSLLADDIVREFHAEVGGLVARAWKFPDELHDAIRWHHKYDEAPSGRPVARLLHAANLFAHAVGFRSYEVEEDITLVKEPSLREMGIGPADIELISKNLSEKVHSLIDGFTS